MPLLGIGSDAAHTFPPSNFVREMEYSQDLGIPPLQNHHLCHQGIPACQGDVEGNFFTDVLECYKVEDRWNGLAALERWLLDWNRVYERRAAAPRARLHHAERLITPTDCASARATEGLFSEDFLTTGH
jgi:hypothetical protein